jgi:gamma-glutamyl:cysteine ligase YbdK (ATP-grasp superfamily)
MKEIRYSTRLEVFTSQPSQNTRHLAVKTAAYDQLVQQQAHTGFMWEKSLENVRFGDRRN